MATSILFAKVLGLFTLLSVVYMVGKKDEVRDLYENIAGNRTLLRSVGMIEVLAGLFLVFGHPVWEGWQLIITLFGVLAVVEGVIYMFLPRRKIRKIYQWLLQPTPYYIMTVIAVVLGVYLTYIGFTV